MTDQQSPGVLFVCVKNSGKSQMAAALMRQLAGDSVAVFSAGTHPGTGLNAQSAESLTEVGASVAGEQPKPVTAELLAQVRLVVLVGSEVTLETPGVEQERWLTDEPSARGIEGMARMRLIREDIASRVIKLYHSRFSNRQER
ncbi:low molecular weight phosphatase family protein [Psychromicrobium lacuslunae]|uniref:Arsenate reductase n=1 Tax=Psychromicrobium lacuslunae TaxID=1618207 RepID=A0A0D4C0I9_9MICC|nr:low molecular weight phosphatase family protein [Psychromicrobium lacuslunae]AJT42187.1 arsenate reductase [Psychromicrobium lacuslunae]